MTLIQDLEARLANAFQSVLGETVSAPVVAAADLRFGDYQSNAAMALAKQRKTNPRALAEQVIAALDLADLGTADIAGPGFINFKLAPSSFAARAKEQLADPRLGVPEAAEKKTIVLDFSAPNVAKPMHIGHIRSTIIGDALSRIARFLGHHVITDNHIGDWGTQFGMVTWAWKQGLNEQALLENPLQELLRLYRHASDSSKADESIREACRQELVKLQQGDEENFAIWQRCIELSRAGLDKIYDRLDVSFDHWLGESAYNDALAPLVERLQADGIARESEGALCIFSNGEPADQAKDPFLIRKDGEWTDFPMIIRKSDGAFNYATTDIATVEFRRKEWKADAAWYVVDHRQSQHFHQLFSVAARLGYGEMDLRHISFGTILGTDGKPLKTRAGDLPQLDDVLDEAVVAAASAVAERSRVETEEDRKALAELIGISAVKFTELSHHRLSDYVFDLNKMLALQGDTAPYLQYSVVRCRSIFRKLEQAVDLSTVTPLLVEDAEIHLARFLARYGEVVPTLLDDHRPNLLANYLLELARAYHSFNEACPVLKAEEPLRNSRLLLCELTSRVLVHGLGLLGIRCPDQM
ncbi:arginine--tRNA ligase [Luteolibacter sp. GHJ8]|uniref:Arginine--tRNA ligase n=1 Tax=Luteolibacter rhizosphaerae TaxID=2989719 RepID=A0ABT3G273_9BACT|nr:arginine--tRNA ligase [Luteolibacter rhizosphaerae]MCW1913933.1 arginine--tRNA ligase [Luteolibacter rhizosphaerae]